MEGNLDSENSNVTGGLGVGVVDDDMSRLAKEVASLLRKEMAPKCSQHFEA
jgi:hypothetical protein